MNIAAVLATHAPTTLPAVAVGFGLGLLASTIFFLGLAWGMRHALRSTRPLRILLASFLCRTAIIIGLGAYLIHSTDLLWSLPAYVLAFFLARTLVLRKARTHTGAQIAQSTGASK